jgi:hypothetical protein
MPSTLGRRKTPNQQALSTRDGKDEGDFGKNRTKRNKTIATEMIFGEILTPFQKNQF